MNEQIELNKKSILSIGLILKSIREGSLLNQRQIAEKMGKSPVHIQKIESLNDKKLRCPSVPVLIAYLEAAGYKLVAIKSE